MIDKLSFVAKNHMIKQFAFLALFYVVIAVFSCSKKDPATPSNNNNNGNNTTTCKDGYVCFNLDGTDISKPGAGYVLADTQLFVKYEEGAKQLSLDIFGKNTGNYNVSDVRKVGNARIYYFPEANKMYMAASGTFNVSAYDNSAKTVTGTFSGTLYLYDSNNNTFNKTDSMVIKNGYFTKVTLQ